MRAIVCLLACVLRCNVMAAINHEVVEEKNSVTLRCPHPVEGKTTWSREINGNKVDIFTVDGDREIRHNDPGRRYSTQVDKALHILRAAVSDAGRYFCNNEPAVELTVIPPGTVRLTAAEGTRVTLKCPPDVGGSAVPTWSRNSSVIRQKRRFNVSPVDKTLTITDLQPKDSGLYYCDGKPAAYLTVTKGNKAPPKTTTPTKMTTTTLTSTPTPTTPTTTTSTPTTMPTTRQTTTRPTTTPATTTRQTTSTPTEPRPAAATAPSTPPANTDTTKEKGSNKKPGEDENQKQLLFGGIGIVVSFLLLLLLLILYCTWRRRFKKRGSEGMQPVYDEIQEGVVFRPISDGSDPNDPTYCTIPDLPPVGKRTETLRPNECPYSLIDSTFLGGNNEGSTQLSALLEKPKEPENNNDQSFV